MSDLTTTALALEASHDRLGWGLPARLFGISADHTWVLVDEGEPYTIVELFSLLPGEDFVAIALVCEGWAAPLGARRPSRHPRRTQIRTVVAVARDGERVSVVRCLGGPPEVIEGGKGELMARLLAIWPRLAAHEN